MVIFLSVAQMWHAAESIEQPVRIKLRYGTIVEHSVKIHHNVILVTIIMSCHICQDYHVQSIFAPYFLSLF